MGSGSSYRGTTSTYDTYERPSSWSAPPPPDPAEARRAREAEEAAEAERETARRRRVEEARKRTESAKPPPRSAPRDDKRSLYDASLARNRITRPDPLAESATIVIVDNSSSNSEVATRMRETSGYILGVLGKVAGERSQMALLFGSDHCDGHAMRYDVDFLAPSELGERVMTSSIFHVHGAGGGDDAEAFECFLHDVCDVDFGGVAKPDRHLILATDMVAHGMGLRERGLGSDHGCPSGRDWRASVRRVNETFGTFQVIATGTSSGIAELQRQFLSRERVAFDHIDLSAVREMEHRLGIVPNVVLFLAARNRFGSQGAKFFLKFLYEKWLDSPIFGQDTDMRARDAISRFFKYVEGMNPEMEREWQKDIFAD